MGGIRFGHQRVSNVWSRIKSFDGPENSNVRGVVFRRKSEWRLDLEVLSPKVSRLESKSVSGLEEAETTGMEWMAGFADAKVRNPKLKGRSPIWVEGYNAGVKHAAK